MPIATEIHWWCRDYLRDRKLADGTPSASTHSTTGYNGDPQAENCSSFLKQIDIFGYEIHPWRLAVANTTTEAIQKLKIVTNPTDTCSFIRLRNVFHRSVPNFSWITASLNRKLIMDHPKIFTGFDLLKKQGVESWKGILSSRLILALPTTFGYYTVCLDACNKPLECVLLREHLGGSARPTGYW